MEMMAGTLRIKQYVFSRKDLLGKGATGSVYFGQDTNTGQKVALKLIDMSKIDNQVTVYLLSNQKRALSSLKHPNVVRALDIIQQKDYCYIITEFCNQGTLSDKIYQKGRLGQDQAFLMFRSIVQGYRACLQQNILHRDIKPTNILMNNGTPKLSDFGYCQIMGSKKPSIYYNVGSPSYMAPETFALNQYSEKSDVWALGVTLYEMVIGETFDRGRDVMQCIYNIGKEGMAYPKHVSPYCRYVIDQCLCLDPTSRIGLEKLVAILDNKAKICHSISNNIISPTNTSNQQKQRIWSEADLPMRLKTSYEVQRHNPLGQIPMTQRYQAHKPHTHTVRHQNFPHRGQQTNSYNGNLEGQQLRPVTHYQTSHSYQQQNQFHQPQHTVIESINSNQPQDFPRLLSHHAKLQQYDNSLYNNSEPYRFGVGVSLQQSIHKPLENSFHRPTEVSLRHSQRGIVIPLHHNAMPTHSPRPISITQQRPVTHFVPSPQSQRYFTQVHQQASPQINQKAFQKPQVINQYQTNKPLSHYSPNQFQPPKLQDQSLRQRMANLPISPAFSSQIPRPSVITLKNSQIPSSYQMLKPHSIARQPPPRTLTNTMIPQSHRNFNQIPYQTHSITHKLPITTISSNNVFPTHQSTTLPRGNSISKPGLIPSPPLGSFSRPMPMPVHLKPTR